jgi:hypothetical protein
LRVHLFSGWQARQTAEGIPQLAKGSVAVDIHSASFSGDAGALYNTFVDQMASGGARLTATPPSLVQIGAGLAGARGAYTGFFGSNELEGQLTTFTLGGVGYVFDAWGPMGTLRPLLGEVELMINTIEVRQ